MSPSETFETELPSREGRSSSPGDATASPLDRRTQFLVTLGTWLLVALGSTWRMRVYGRHRLAARRPEDSRAVIAFWHGELLGVAWAHRRSARALVSEHRDGEIITRVIGRFGLGAVRGSSSRSGARALLECVTILRRGVDDIVITPDGPRGPRHQFSPGALVVAFRAQAPLVPLAVHADRAWRLKSWDQFMIPKPFARVTMLYGEPIVVSGAHVREVSARTEEFAAALNANIARVTELARQG
jgi:lysophospholipid acyltransferase (LPLAT)-like uncharacterized protein